jgi:hypothetical protein
VRRNQRLREDFGGWLDLPKQFANRRPQPVGMCGIEQARRRQRFDFHALRSFLHHCLDRVRYPHMQI